MAGYYETVSNLPLCNLSHREFNAIFGSWSDRCNDFDLYELLSNPDRFDECNPDVMLTNPCSDYYSVHNFSKI